jgi:DNA polymerase V
MVKRPRPARDDGIVYLTGMKLRFLNASKNIEFYSAETAAPLELPFAQAISAGFPSPASDYLEMSLDLNRELVSNPSATFYGRVRGDSMIDAGIHDGDILIIDRSLEPASNRKAVCFVDGQFTIKTLKVAKGEVWLKAENEKYPPIRVTPENDFLVWGIVTHVIHRT